jgi:hypothetical protein
MIEKNRGVTPVGFRLSAALANGGTIECIAPADAVPKFFNYAFARRLVTLTPSFNQIHE